MRGAPLNVMPLNWHRRGLSVGRGRVRAKHNLRRETAGILQEVVREKLIWRERERERERNKWPYIHFARVYNYVNLVQIFGVRLSLLTG